MSDYTKVNNFAAKDAINAPVVGEEFQNEFDAIQTAVNSKVDEISGELSSPSLTGVPTTSTPDGQTPEQVTNVEYVQPQIDNLQAQIDGTATLQRVYPIGSIYINAATEANPSSLLGFGTWSRYAQGRVLVGLNESDPSFNSLGETGGAKTHTLTVNEMPSHSHSTQVNTEPGVSTTGFQDGLFNTGRRVSTNAVGGNQPHNNLQPYITVYMWRRVA